VYQQGVYLRHYLQMKKDRHPSTERLYQAVAVILKQPSVKQAEVARALNESEQAVNNWEKRASGISAQGCISVQKKLGVNASWLHDGEGDMFVTGLAAAPQLPALGGADFSRDAQDLVRLIIEGDKRGMSQDALNALKEMVRLLSKPEQLPGWTADGDEPPN
jgi:transcriptional regulator with XRE-family HTH domain